MGASSSFEIVKWLSGLHYSDKNSFVLHNIFHITPFPFNVWGVRKGLNASKLFKAPRNDHQLKKAIFKLEMD